MLTWGIIFHYALLVVGVFNISSKVIAGRFNISSKHIHCGNFGCIYPAMDLNEKKESNKLGYNQKIYAVKIQDKKSKPLTNHGGNNLYSEYIMYQTLSGKKGIPRMYAYEEYLHKEILVMDMLGDSLYTLLIYKCHGKFSVKTVLMLAEQMIIRIQFLHERGFVHTDLKPNNWVIGFPGSFDKKTIFILDFNLASRWKKSTSQELAAYKKNGKNNKMLSARLFHREYKNGRKEDLMKMCSTFIRFLGVLE